MGWTSLVTFEASEEAGPELDFRLGLKVLHDRDVVC